VPRGADARGVRRTSWDVHGGLGDAARAGGPQAETRTPRPDGAGQGVLPGGCARSHVGGYGAAAMAVSCASVSARSAAEPIPPTLAAMAAWVADTDAPFLEFPWQVAQCCV